MRRWFRHEPNFSGLMKLDDIFRECFGDDIFNPAYWGSRNHTEVKDGKVLVHVELPGVAPDEVTVNLEGAILIIEAHAKKVVSGQVRPVIQRFPLGDGFRPENISAVMKDGLLTITITPPEATKNPEGQRINVTAG